MQKLHRNRTRRGGGYALWVVGGMFLWGRGLITSYSFHLALTQKSLNNAGYFLVFLKWLMAPPTVQIRNIKLFLFVPFFIRARHCPIVFNTGTLTILGLWYRYLKNTMENHLKTTDRVFYKCFWCSDCTEETPAVRATHLMVTWCKP